MIMVKKKKFKASLFVNFNIDISKIPQTENEVKELYNIICSENTIENVLYAREWVKMLGYEFDNSTKKSELCEIIKSHLTI